MRAKFINEKFAEDSDPVYDMGIGLDDILFLKDKKVVFYYFNRGILEYRNEVKNFTNTSRLASFFRNKDYLLYCNSDDHAIAWIECKTIASFISAGYGAIYMSLRFYKKFKREKSVNLIKHIIYK